MLCILILFHNVSNYKAKQSKENGLSKKQLTPAAHQPPVLYDPNEPFYEDELDSILDDPAIFELYQQQDFHLNHSIQKMLLFRGSQSFN